MRKNLLFTLSLMASLISGCTGDSNTKRYSDKKPVLIKTISTNTGNIEIYKKRKFNKRKSKTGSYLTSTYRFYVKNNTSQSWCVNISLKKQKNNSIQIWVRGKRYLFYREPRLILSGKTIRYAMSLYLPKQSSVKYQAHHRLPSNSELRWKRCKK